MRKSLYIVILLTVSVTLGMTFYPVGTEDEFYAMYLLTSDVAEATFFADDLDAKYEEFVEATKNLGAMELVYPLKDTTSKHYLSSEVGPRNLAISAGTFHHGLDLSVAGNPTNIEVVSASDGVVKSSGYQGPITKGKGGVGAGNFIFIETNMKDGYPVVFKYLHLKDKPALTTGQKVTKGQVLGIMGNSGGEGKYEMGIHLHYEIEIGGVNIVIAESISSSRRTVLHPFNPTYFSYSKATLPKSGIIKKDGTIYPVVDY